MAGKLVVDEVEVSTSMVFTNASNTASIIVDNIVAQKVIDRKSVV